MPSLPEFWPGIFWQHLQVVLQNFVKTTVQDYCSSHAAACIPFGCHFWLTHVCLYLVCTQCSNPCGALSLLASKYFCLNDTQASALQAAIQQLPAAISSTNPHAILLGLASLVVALFSPKRITKIVPSALLALIAGTGASVLLGLGMSPPL